MNRKLLCKACAIKATLLDHDILDMCDECKTKLLKPLVPLPIRYTLAELQDIVGKFLEYPVYYGFIEENFIGMIASRIEILYDFNTAIQRAVKMRELERVHNKEYILVFMQGSSTQSKYTTVCTCSPKELLEFASKT